MGPGRCPVVLLSTTVEYQDATVSVFGWQWDWIVAFLVFTIVFGFALQKPLRVKL